MSNEGKVVYLPADCLYTKECIEIIKKLRKFNPKKFNPDLYNIVIDDNAISLSGIKIETKPLSMTELISNPTHPRRVTQCIKATQKQLTKYRYLINFPYRDYM